MHKQISKGLVEDPIRCADAKVWFVWPPLKTHLWQLTAHWLVLFVSQIWILSSRVELLRPNTMPIAAGKATTWVRKNISGSRFNTEFALLTAIKQIHKREDIHCHTPKSICPNIFSACTLPRLFATCGNVQCHSKTACQQTHPMWVYHCLQLWFRKPELNVPTPQRWKTNQWPVFSQPVFLCGANAAPSPLITGCKIHWQWIIVADPELCFLWQHHWQGQMQFVTKAVSMHQCLRMHTRCPTKICALLLCLVGNMWQLTQKSLFWRGHMSFWWLKNWKLWFHNLSRLPKKKLQEWLF